MMSEIGQRHIEQVRERLTAFERGDLSLQSLITDLEALFGLLVDEADPEWVDDLQAECNRLEFVHAAALQTGRQLTGAERTEVADAVTQLRLVTERY